MNDQQKYVLSGSIRRFFQQHLMEGFRELSNAADKHGSLEWMVAWSESDLRRYVSVFVLETNGSAPNDGLYNVECWAGADNSINFHRQLAHVFKGALRHKLSKKFEAGLWAGLEAARAQALSIEESDLQQQYVPPAAGGTELKN